MIHFTINLKSYIIVVEAKISEEDMSIAKEPIVKKSKKGLVFPLIARCIIEILIACNAMSLFLDQEATCSKTEKIQEDKFQLFNGISKYIC